MADTRLLVGLCLSLLISSLAISLVTGTGAASLGDIAGTVNQTLDFETDFHGWKNDIFTVGSDWKIIDGALTSQSPGSNRFFLQTGGKPDGVHTTTYHIESGGRPYAVIIRDTGYHGDSIQLRVVPAGVYLESYEVLGYRAYHKYYPASIPQNAVISVSLDEATSRVTATVNGNDIILMRRCHPTGYGRGERFITEVLRLQAPGLGSLKLSPTLRHTTSNRSTCSGLSPHSLECWSGIRRPGYLWLMHL